MVRYILQALDTTSQLREPRSIGHPYGRILQSATDIYMDQISFRSIATLPPVIHQMGAPNSPRKIIMTNSTYAEHVEEFGVPRCTLSQTLNEFFPILKCVSLKHLWDPIHNVDVKKEIVREAMIITTTGNKIGRETYLFNDEEAYIKEMDCQKL